MERVAQLLQARQHRQALVRLWVLGLSGPVLSAWEQSRSAPGTFEQEVAQFLADLQNEVSLTLDRIQAAPLAIVRALDDCVASTGAHYNRAARSSRKELTWQEEGRDYWLVPVVLQARRHASLNKQAGSLGAWFHRHVVIPAKTAHGLDVEVSLSQSTVDDGLSQLLGAAVPELRAWIGHFNDGADVTWSQNDLGNWRTQIVAPQEVRTRSVLAAVAEAARVGAQVLVFPEFTLDLAQRQTLQQHLRRHPDSSVILVVAGSFHEQVGSEAFNTAPVCSGAGRVLFTHRKLRLFGDLGRGAEDVLVGQSVQVLVTPIGCITALICKDFIDAHASVESLLTEVPVDWVFVPSFGDERTIRAHKMRAKQLAVVKTGANSVVAQTLNTAVVRDAPPSECVRGFGHVGGRSEPEEPVGESGGLVCFPLTAEAQRPQTGARPALKRVK